MFYRFALIFFLSFLIISVPGCGGEDERDGQISQLKDQVSELKDKIAEQANTIAELNKQVGEGKRQYLEEDRQKTTTVIISSVILCALLFVIVIIWATRYRSKLKKKTDKEKDELKGYNAELSKVVNELEHTIAKLKYSLEEGERNEVSNLIKSLKSERDIKIQKIGGVHGKS